MLQKKAQVVSESMYFTASGETTLDCLANNGGKPLESLFETRSGLVVRGIAGGAKWGPIIFFISFSYALEQKMWPKAFCSRPGWVLFQLSSVYLSAATIRMEVNLKGSVIAQIY